MNSSANPGLLIVLPLFGALLPVAQADDTLDEIVVSATRLETSVRDAARSVSLVDKERIQNGTQQLGFDEALAGVPGLYMQNRYNFAQDLRISLRGFGAQLEFRCTRRATGRGRRTGDTAGRAGAG